MASEALHRPQIASWTLRRTIQDVSNVLVSASKSPYTLRKAYAVLRWSDIQANQFTIAQTIRRNRNFDDMDSRRTSMQVSTSKTKAGRRTIPLTPKLKEILAEQKRHQAQSRILAGDEWHEMGPVFTTEPGTPLEGRSLARTLHRVLKELSDEFSAFVKQCTTQCE